MKKKKPLAILAASLAAASKKLLQLKTALLSDVMGKSGAMDHDMKCFSAHCRMAGPAFSLRLHPADILMVGKAVSLCPPRHVLVIDGQGNLDTALWGSIITVAARIKGLEGVVIDGAIRDLGEIHREPFPVFARAVVPNAGGAEYAGEVNLPIQCAGVVVNPKDWMVGDEDGVVVIPSSRLREVIQRAKELLQVEREIEQAVRVGGDLAAILHCDEALQAKSRKAFFPQLRFKK